MVNCHFHESVPGLTDANFRQVDALKKNTLERFGSVICNTNFSMHLKLRLMACAQQTT
jgi:hypothetical protein